MKKPQSPVWEHFTPIKDERGKLVEAECKRCNKRFVTKHGTRSMRRHVGSKTCMGRVRKSRQPQHRPQPQLSGPGESSCREPAGLDDQEASRDLARMIVLHGHDPSVLEDDYFRSFVRRLNPQFKMPKRLAIEEVCDGIFDETRRDLFSRLRSAPGRVSLAVGKAKTPEAGEVMYIACHFIDDQWNLHKVALDALMVQGEKRDFTDGPILGVRVFDDEDIEDVIHVISEHEDRLYMLACDDDFHGLKDYIDCSCTTPYVDIVLHSIARCLLPDSYFAAGDIFQDLNDLNLTRQERLQLLSELDLDLELAFNERWYACYCSLQVLRKRGFTELAGAELCVQLLCKVWEQIFRSIQRISASTSPTSNLCLAELLKLREILQPELARVSGDEAYDYFYKKEVVDVLSDASDILDKAIQNSYLDWSVPLALDPRYKLKYIEFSFKRAFGSEAAKYVSEVTTKINNMYADYTEEFGTITAADHSDSANLMMDTTTSADPLEQAWNEHCRSLDVMATQVTKKTELELDRYLQDPLAPAITKDFDVLKWWKAHSLEYPMVARMARDVLAMPTCSKLSSDQLAQARSILRGYSKKPRQMSLGIAIEDMRDDICSNEARRDTSSNFAMNKAKINEEDEEVEESSQAKAKAAERPNQERTVIGHGKTTTDPPSQAQGDRNEWVLDTTSWFHHTFNQQLLCDLTTHNLEEVADMLPSEGQDWLPVLGCGSVDTEDFAIPDVRYNQFESRNVISVAQLARSHALVTVFEPTRCYVMDKLSRKIVGKGRLRNGAYVMDYLRISQDGGGQAGGQERERKQEEGRGGSGGGHFGGGKNDGGGVQGRGGSQAGGGADGGGGGDKDKEGRKDQHIKKEDKEENEEEGKEEKGKTEKEEETKGGEEDITEEEHQQLSQVLQGMSGLSQSMPDLSPSESVFTISAGYVFMTPQRISDFILDSGASYHITHFPLNQGIFKVYPSHLNITPPTQSITGVEGGRLDVYGIGYLEGPDDAIDYVLYVPSSVGNCVSLAKLLADYSVRAVFDVHTFSIVKLATWVVVGFGKENGNQYVLHHFQAGRLVQTN